MASLSANPQAVAHYLRAPSGQGGLVKVGAYRFSGDTVGAIYVAENVLCDSLSGRSPVTFKPILAPDVDPHKERFKVTDFKGDFRKATTNMRFEVYTVPPSAEAPNGRPGEQFKFKPADRSFSHGSAYGGPIEAPDGEVRAHWDRACREILHWIMKHVEGFDDLFFEDPKVVASLSAKATPPVETAKDKTFEELGVKPRQRPISADSASTRSKLDKAAVLDGDKPSRIDNAPTVHTGVHLEIIGSQTGFRIIYDGPGPDLPNNADVRRWISDLQEGLLPEHIARLPIEEIMPTLRVLDHFQQVLEGGLIDREAAIRTATGGRQYPGTRNYERCTKHIERIVERLNAGTLAKDLDEPPFGYRLETEAKPQIVGISNAPGEHPSRQMIFYRKIAIEAQTEMQVLR